MTNTTETTKAQADEMQAERVRIIGFYRPFEDEAEMRAEAMADHRAARE